jgi:hypothetical protein
MAQTLLQMIVMTAAGKKTGKLISVELNPDGTPVFELLKPYILTALEPAEEYEHVNVFWTGQYLDMFVDEMSALKGLPRNDKATKIYLNNMRTHDPENPALIDPPAIYGPAVLFDAKVWF